MNVKTEEKKQLDNQQVIGYKNVLSSFKEMFIWFIHNIPFILIPGSRLEELSQREYEFEKTRSQRKFLARLKTPLTMTGIVIIFVIVSFAVFAPWISDYTFDELNGLYTGAWAGPSPEHPLGTTKFGRDILGRMIFGARSSLTIALPALVVSAIMGSIIGIMSAYYGGWVDTFITFITDVLLAFPALILALVLVAIFGSSLEMIVLTFGLLGIPGYIRLIRGQVLQAKELTYVKAARVIGASDIRIMFLHILPNVISPIIIAFTFNLGGIILALAGLSFLGFTDPSLIEWGNDINVGRSFLYDAPQASFWPGMMILITVLGFMLLGDGLRDALDPKMKNL